MKKKFLSALLALCMVLTLLPVSVLAAGDEPFTDVTEGADWFHESVQYVFENDLMDGVDGTNFDPYGPLTRGLMVESLWRVAGRPTGVVGMTFGDVAVGDPYYDAIQWASANGIINGYPNGNFGPNDTLTREQMVTLEYRYLGWAGEDVSATTDLSGYPDADQICGSTLAAMQWAVATGIVKGMSDGTLAPDATAVRASVAVVLQRVDEATAPEAETCTVTFDWNFGSKGTYTTVDVVKGESPERPTNPRLSGYSFGGWYMEQNGGKRFLFTTEVTEDITLYARWYEDHYCSFGNWTSNEDGTHTGTCSCGATETQDCASWSYADPVAETTHTKSCSVCGYTVTEYHEYDNYKCVCGKDITPTEGVTEDPVAMIGSTGYATVSAAIAAAQDSDTITLLPGVFDTINFPNSTADNLTIVGGEGVTVGEVELIKTTNYGAPDGLTLQNITFNGRGIFASGTGNQINDLSVLGCKFTNGAMLGLNGDVSVDGLTVQGSNFEATAGASNFYKTHIIVQGSCKDVLISGNIMANAEYNAIQLAKINGAVRIDDNQISNTGSRAMRFTMKTGAELTITNNTISNANTNADEALENKGEVVKVTGTGTVTATGNTVGDLSGILVNVEDFKAILDSLTYDEATKTWTVKTERALRVALGNAVDGDTIALANDIELTEELYLKDIPALTIDGKGKTISADPNTFNEILEGQYQLLKIETPNAVVLQNITLKHRALNQDKGNYHTLDIHTSPNVTLTDVTLIRDFANESKPGAPLVINNSKVTVTGKFNVTADGNAWYGFNVDKGGELIFDADAKIEFSTEGAQPFGRVENGTLTDNTGKWAVESTYGFVLPATVKNTTADTVYATLQDALNDATDGDTITLLDSITAAETISVTKPVVIDGNNKTITCTQSGLIIGADLTSLEVKNLTLTGTTAVGNETGSCTGLGTFNVNYKVDDLKVTNCTIQNFDYGLYFGAGSATPAAKQVKATVTNTTLQNNLVKGAYLENWTESSFVDCDILNNGNNTSKVADSFKNWICGIDLNLKFGTYQDITVTGCTFTGNGANNGGALMIKARGTGSDTGYASNPATLVGVTVSGCTFSGNNWDIVLGEKDKQNTSPARVTISDYDTTKDTYKDYRGLALPGLGTEEAPYEIASVAELKAFRDAVNAGNTFSGKTMKLMADIDLNNEDWTPIGLDAANNGSQNTGNFFGTFDGNNQTIKNLIVSVSGNNRSAGLFGATTGIIKNLTIDGATISGTTDGTSGNGIGVLAGSTNNGRLIENITVKNATIIANKYAGGIVGFMNGSIIGCKVEDVEITVTPLLLSGTTYDHGDKVGGLIGSCQAVGNSSYNPSGYNVITGNTVKNVTIKAYRDVGGLIGLGRLAADEVSGNTVTNVTIIVDQVTGFYEAKAPNAAYLVGRVEDGTVNAGNDINNNITTEGEGTNTITVKIADGFTLMPDGTYEISNANGMKYFAKTVNTDGNSYDGKTVKLADNIEKIDLENTAWTPIGQTGAYQFKGTFDGNNKTISNLSIDSTSKTDGYYSSGLFGWLNAAKVKNVTIEGATVKGNHNVGVIAGYMETSGCTIENCHVTGATITCTHANGEACGDKAGVIVGHAGNAGVVVKDCTATDSTVTAGRDAGQVVGAALTANVTGCSANNVTVTAGGDCTGANIRNEVIGRIL